MLAYEKERKIIAKSTNRNVVVETLFLKRLKVEKMEEVGKRSDEILRIINIGRSDVAAPHS